MQGLRVASLATMVYARAERPDGDPFLVVAPTSVVTAWVSEAARHAPHLRIGVVTRRTDDVAAIAAESDLVVTTYTLLRLAQPRYANRPWAGLVLDEAQQVKNHNSKTYAAVRTIAQAGLHPANCRLLDAGEAATSGASTSGGCVLVLGVEDERNAAIWDSAVQLYTRAQSYPTWAQALSGSADHAQPGLAQEREVDVRCERDERLGDCHREHQQ